MESRELLPGFFYNIAQEIYPQKVFEDWDNEVAEQIKNIPITYYSQMLKRNVTFYIDILKLKYTEKKGSRKGSKFVKNEITVHYPDHMKKFNRYLKVRNIRLRKGTKSNIKKMLLEAMDAATSLQHKKMILDSINDKELLKNRKRYNELKDIWFLGAKNFAMNLLRFYGAKRYYKSGKSAANSSYYEKDGIKFRLSNHELPETEARIFLRNQGKGGKWIEIILDEIQPFSEIKENINYIFENI